MSAEKPESRNSVLLWSFMRYCWNHPHERFWQALRNWSGASFIFRLDEGQTKPIDTFYREEK